MKALTLTQPWATLVAIGEKKWETRSWPTRYRGPIAIHAAKGFPADAQAVCFGEYFYETLTQAQCLTPNDRNLEGLPRGFVIATVDLVDCQSTDAMDYWEIGPKELAFGDYRANRFAWKLQNVKPLPEPIPARGALSLWEWTPPAGMAV